MSAGLLFSSAVSATADEPPDAGAKQCAPNIICQDANTGGKKPVPGPTPTGGGGGGGGGVELCMYHDKVYACHDPELGWFSGGCYFRPMDNPPAEGAEEWQGHKASEGALYTKVCLQDDGTQDGAKIVFLNQAPAKPAPIDLADEGRRLADQMVFPDPVAGVAPKGTAVVHTPVWLWVEGMTAPAPKSLGVPGASVTVTPKLRGVTWDFDKDLTPVNCAGVGTPYEEKYRDGKSPDCGYEFAIGSGKRKSGVFDGTVTAHWVGEVVVTGPNAKTFDIEMGRAATFSLRVAEVQVLN
ncbi:hypothetical protein [Kitasatospora sp. NPDC097643]|uniref:hypothetical protein n=1 Tax=Kitasatospora sp. NPDC097643 TaxID=3157230 RepID=UPI0033271AD1